METGTRVMTPAGAGTVVENIDPTHVAVRLDRTGTRWGWHIAQLETEDEYGWSLAADEKEE